MAAGDFRGFSSPNTTQVPDELFDKLMTQLSEAELRVLLYIIRRTFGFKKGSDNVSIGQMVSGIVGRNGRRLDHGTGLSKSGVIKAIKGLIEKKAIVATRRADNQRGYQPTNYRLNLLGHNGADPSPHGGGEEEGEDPREHPPLSTGVHKGVHGGAQALVHGGAQPLSTAVHIQQTVTNKQLHKVVNDVTANDQKSSPQGNRPRVISDPALRSKYTLTEEQIGRVHWLVEKQGEILGAVDRNHAGYVKRAAEAVCDGLGEALDYKLGDFKQAAAEIAVASRPAYFHTMWREEVKNRSAHHPAPHPTSTGSSGTPQRLGTLFSPSGASSDASIDPRITRMIADAERRGVPIPPHIRTADIQAVNRWWATLPETPIKRP